MADLTNLGADDARTFMIAAGLVFEIIAAFCSSPQTAEINANKRSATLMKWVVLGLGLSAVFVGIAAYPMKGGKPAIMGGMMAGGVMGIAYAWANYTGLHDGQSGTESY